MKQSEAMWNIFAITGNIEAYLLYKKIVKNEAKKKGWTGREQVSDF